jgi:zeaxanthin glucosyltransferase
VGSNTSKTFRCRKASRSTLVDLQIAIPVTYDQPGVAARIAHKKTGVVISLDKLTVDHLASVLSEVLTDATYRENARKMQKAIADANGLSVAADLIEESLGVKK